MPITNELGEIQDLYIPRKCNATGKLIGARDHASIMINIAMIDPETGLAIPNENERISISGKIRRMGESDDCINRLAQEKGLLKKVWSSS